MTKYYVLYFLQKYHSEIRKKQEPMKEGVDLQVSIKENKHIFDTLNKIKSMAIKCKVCGLKFEEKKRLQIHKKVQGRKPKISEYW